MTNGYDIPQTGGIFFLGLGLTFLLLAVLASLQWAYIPGVILLVMGVLLGYSQFTGLLNYVWPAALILVGLLLIFQFTRRK
jgi:purine-cytosine permease-like protein